MISNERCYEIRKHVTKLLYKNGKGITKEMKPQNKEEEEYFNKLYLWELERKKESDDYNRRYDLAFKEVNELVSKYKSKDYKPMGKFNNPIFKLKEKKIEKLVKEEIEKHPEVQKDLIIDDFYMNTKIRLFKEIYNIDWLPFEATISDELLEKYYKIIDKYQVGNVFDIRF